MKTKRDPNLFAALEPSLTAPLADELRPQSLEEVVGQEHLLADGGTLTRLLGLNKLPSLILWGPPGSGKTTLARLLAQHTTFEFVQLSAVFSGVADLRAVFDQAKSRSKGTLLFIDEIHRFNKSQQDALLGPVEAGLVTLIGATTENLSFALNSALLSRTRVLIVNRLSESALETLLKRAETHLNTTLPLTIEARKLLLDFADGDGRVLLNLVETLGEQPQDSPLDPTALGVFLQRRAALYDKSQDYHYNLISAFIKSMRGSDADAALYWMARMLKGGEDPLFIARRLMRFAAEDIGLADPQASLQALAAMQSYERLGSPEGELSIAVAVVYCATAPKSNAIYTALKKATKAAENSGSLPPPMIIVNAPTTLMKESGYGEGYIYDHDTEEGFSGQNYFPLGLKRQQFYKPVARGFERDIQKRLDYWQKLREKG